MVIVPGSAQAAGLLKRNRAIFTDLLLHLGLSGTREARKQDPQLLQSDSKARTYKVKAPCARKSSLYLGAAANEPPRRKKKRRV